VAKAIEIRPLAKDDDRSGFSCGQPDLDRFFQHYAGQNQFKLRLAVTYVAVETQDTHPTRAPRAGRGRPPALAWGPTVAAQ